MPALGAESSDFPRRGFSFSPPVVAEANAMEAGSYLGVTLKKRRGPLPSGPYQVVSG
jgi:hypothetical protein